VLAYFGIAPQEFDRLKELDKEICHYLNVQVTLKDVSELQTYVDAVHDAARKPDRERELDERFAKGKITQAQYKAGLKALERIKDRDEFDHEGRKLSIELVPNHYYLPVLLDEQERADYIKHVIRTPSEVRFVRDLEKYLADGGAGFGEYDWWMWCLAAPLRVSKLNESLDEVKIPYYDPQQNRIRDFKPDFVFWLQKDGQYHIAFVDPKGITIADYQRKLDGYRALFEKNGSPRPLSHEGMKVAVHALLYSREAGAVAEGYRRFWVGSIAELLKKVGA
jgi:hypothetical protein